MLWIRSDSIATRHAVYMRFWVRIWSGVASAKIHIRSASLLSLDSVVQMAANAAITILIARILGPSELGMWSYVFALYSLALTASALGMDQILIVDFTMGDRQEDRVLATALTLRLAAALVAMLVLLGIGFADAAGRGPIFMFAAIGLPIAAFDVLATWFKAKALFGSAVAPSIVSNLLGVAGRLALLLGTRSLPLAALGASLQVVVQQVMYLAAFHRAGGRVRFRSVDPAYARELLGASWPLLLSALMQFGYNRANLLLLEHLRGPVEVGIYSAATRLSEAAYILPTALAVALRPMLYRQAQLDRKKFIEMIDQILAAATLTCGLVCLIVTALSPYIVNILFGENFTSSILVLQIHIWTLVCVAQGLISGIWLLHVRATKIYLAKTLAGMAVNLIGGAVLIPHYGAVGAASASLAAQATACILVHAFGGRTPALIFRHQIGAFILKGFWRRMGER